ncbi:hypothetical protein M2S24_19295, partial [Klebsiella pneumoniae]|nr:hypothetical protein [Klebsiella pneumoniae]
TNIMVGYRQTNQKTDTGKTLTRWPVFVDHFNSNWNSPLAHQAAGAQVNQQNTYNIYGGNAQEIGQEVSRRQLDANARVLRNNQTGAG